MKGVGARADSGQVQASFMKDLGKVSGWVSLAVHCRWGYHSGLLANTTDRIGMRGELLKLDCCGMLWLRVLLETEFQSSVFAD